MGNPKSPDRLPAACSEAQNRVESCPLEVDSGQNLTSPPNAPETLHRGVFLLKQRGTSLPLDGTVQLHWLPAPEVRFEGRSEKIAARVDLDGAEFSTGPAGLRGRALVLNHEPLEGRYTGILNGWSVRGRRRSVRSAGFQLLNFPAYLGQPVRRMVDQGVMLSRARLSFHTENWTVNLDEIRDYPKKLPKIRARGGYVASHVGEITAAPGGVLPFQQIEQIRERLHLFFGFLAGQWVGPVLLTGKGMSGPVWTEYSSWRVTPSRQPRSWLPHHVATDVEPLLASFDALYSKPLWNRAIRTLVNWYVHANAESGTIESALTAATIPLELLAWLVMVEDGKHISARKFDDLSAGRRLEALLDRAGVPTRVPDHLPHLRDSNLAETGKTGPACLLAVRNGLVHPKKARRDRLAEWDRRVLFELKELALSYVELAFLHVLGYRGRYARRMFQGWKGEDLAPVPWA